MLFVAVILGGNLREKVYRCFFALVLITFAGALSDTLIMLFAGTPGQAVYTTIRITDVVNYGANHPREVSP